jgi:hypothetical protein
MPETKASTNKYQFSIKKLTAVLANQVNKKGGREKRKKVQTIAAKGAILGACPVPIAAANQPTP